LLVSFFITLAVLFSNNNNTRERFRLGKDFNGDRRISRLGIRTTKYAKSLIHKGDQN